MKEGAEITQPDSAEVVESSIGLPRGTKKVGLEDLRTIKSVVHIPVAAIGDIKVENAPPVMEMGVDGVAMVSAIMEQTDICEVARQLLFRLKRGKV